jgi:hypothetical protein
MAADDSIDLDEIIAAENVAVVDTPMYDDACV